MKAPDAFKSTAQHYSKHRLQYSPEVFQGLATCFALDGRGRLLDLGCGTGQIILPFSAYFEEAVGMDPEPEMLDEARRIASERGVSNIRWVLGGSDDLTTELGEFRLVTMGFCFHWMDQDETLARLYDITEPGGGVVILDRPGKRTEVPRSPSEDFGQVVRTVIRRWLGDERRAGSVLYKPVVEPYESIIERSRFRTGQSLSFIWTEKWDIDRIVGHCFSTSFCSPYVLGEKKDGFEADLRNELKKLNPSGEWIVPTEVVALVLFKE